MAHFGAQIVYVMIFGRTDLRISLSAAKFDAESDFDVRFAVERQNPRQISKKRKFPFDFFAKNFFFGVEKKMSGIVRNAFWQSYAPIGALFET